MAGERGAERVAAAGVDVAHAARVAEKLGLVNARAAAGTIFVGSQDDHLYAVSAKGRVLWSVELPGDVDSSVAISDGGTLVVGCDDGHLRALK